MILWIIKYSVKFLGYYFSKGRSHILANIPSIYLPLHMGCFFLNIYVSFCLVVCMNPCVICILKMGITTYSSHLLGYCYLLAI